MKARRGHLLPFVLLFGLAALVRITVADRHGLWADEFFSLAMATGHSLVAGLLRAAGDAAGALAESRKGLELMRALAAEAPAVAS